MTIYRADPPEIDTIDIELSKKAGKNLGIGFFTSNPRGILVTDIVCFDFKLLFCKINELTLILDSWRYR